ncbi:hypothetical protein [Bdellovibrio sp. HCB-110]|uniref:hypothetical protein n=1 Tax=Bdellovibrio sp. HCB-110 TaxID=3391182 RepID=UPI0039B573C4
MKLLAKTVLTALFIMPTLTLAQTSLADVLSLVLGDQNLIDSAKLVAGADYFTSASVETLENDKYTVTLEFSKYDFTCEAVIEIEKVQAEMLSIQSITRGNCIE